MNEKRELQAVSSWPLKAWAFAFFVLAIIGVAGVFSFHVLIPAFRAKRVVEDPTRLYSHEKERRTAVQRLGGGRSAANSIAKYLWLGLGSVHDQEAAVSILGHCDEHGVSPLVRELVRRTHSRDEALYGLRTIGPKAEAAVSAVGDLLDDPGENSDNKMTAIQVLESIGRPAASQAHRLRGLALGQDEDLRPVAIRALGAILPADDATRQLLSVMETRIDGKPIQVDETWKCWRHALRNVGVGAQGELEKRLVSEVPLRRFLGAIGVNAIEPQFRRSLLNALAEAITQPDHTFHYDVQKSGVSLREVVRDTLVNVCTDSGVKALPELKLLISHPNKDVRAAARTAMERIGAMEEVRKTEGVSPAPLTSPK